MSSTPSTPTSSNSADAPLDWPRALTPSGEVFKKRVDNPKVFRAYMLAKLPTLGVTGAYLEVIEVCACRLILPFSWRTRDLFGRMTQGAIVSAAEMCGTALMVLNLRNQQAALLPRITSLKLESARSVTSQMAFEPEDGEAFGALIAAAAEARAPRQRELVIVGRDEHGEVTHRASFMWELAPKPR